MIKSEKTVFVLSFFCIQYPIRRYFAKNKTFSLQKGRKKYFFAIFYCISNFCY